MTPLNKDIVLYVYNPEPIRNGSKEITKFLQRQSLWLRAKQCIKMAIVIGHHRLFIAKATVLVTVLSSISSGQPPCLHPKSVSTSVERKHFQPFLLLGTI